NQVKSITRRDPTCPPSVDTLPAFGGGGRNEPRAARSPGEQPEADQGLTPSRISLKTIESDNAWKEASTILGDTPTVNQRSPLASRLSISTRVVAPVPPLRIRTL